MAIVGRTGATSASFRRSRWLLTAVLALYFVYTFIPLFYVIAASLKCPGNWEYVCHIIFDSDLCLWR